MHTKSKTLKKKNQNRHKHTAKWHAERFIVRLPKTKQQIEHALL